MFDIYCYSICMEDTKRCSARRRYPAPRHTTVKEGTDGLMSVAWCASISLLIVNSSMAEEGMDAS